MQTCFIVERNNIGCGTITAVQFTQFQTDSREQVDYPIQATVLGPMSRVHTIAGTAIFRMYLPEGVLKNF